MAKVPQLVPTTDLYPRCTMREAVVESSGFCEPCHAANIAERYQERDRVESEARARAWREWDRERQRHHRLMVRLRPAELARPEVDPLELGKEALWLLGKMGQRSAYLLAIREQVGELVRRLAWGPAPPRSQNVQRHPHDQDQDRGRSAFSGRYRISEPPGDPAAGRPSRSRTPPQVLDQEVPFQ